MEIISITHTFQFITKRYRVWEPQSQPHISLCNQISLKFNMFLFACDHRHARFVIQKNKTAINTHALAVANAKICLNGCQILYLFYLLFILIIHTVNAILISRISHGLILKKSVSILQTLWWHASFIQAPPLDVNMSLIRIFYFHC